MTGLNRNLDDDADHRLAGLIDHVLGQEDAATRSQSRSDIAEDLDLALECAEVSSLFESMRGLEPDAVEAAQSNGRPEMRSRPADSISLAVRGAMARRARLRRLPGGGQLGGASGGRTSQVFRGLLVAGVAALFLGCFTLVDRFALRSVRSDRPAMAVEMTASSLKPAPGHNADLAALLDVEQLPVRDPSFVDCVERFESLELPASFDGWLDASAEVEEARRQFALAGSPARRISLLRSIGVPDLGNRTRRLAETVSTKIIDDIVARRVTVRDLSLALRSLLASGSSLHFGEHEVAVKACAVHLVDRLGDLGEGETATALAALADLAVVEGGGGKLGEAVGQYTEVLARSTLTPREDSRPGLLHWGTDVRCLADAGRLLRLAPAFGVHAGVAFRARVMVAAHLDERLERRRDHETPTLLAAQLYGFGDLIDLDATERALKLWRPRLLLPNFVALHHIAWGKHPGRAGWAAFQQDLRGLSGVSTPDSTGDAAALLLCLSTSYAAPGALPFALASVAAG